MGVDQSAGCEQCFSADHADLNCALGFPWNSR